MYVSIGDEMAPRKPDRTVYAAVERDLAKWPADLADSALAASALALASEMDEHNSATSKSMCAKALLETMDRLRSLAPANEEDDALDELRSRRESKFGSASTTHSASS
jgi:hypothetical protein